jgi:hypothetical protein
MRIQIEITERFLSTCGTGTLLGVLVSKCPDHRFGTDGVAHDDEVVLSFHTSSLRYCQQHGEPRSIVMNDYTPMCLVQDVLRLREMGVRVIVENNPQD